MYKWFHTAQVSCNVSFCNQFLFLGVAYLLPWLINFFMAIKLNHAVIRSLGIAYWYKI